MKQLYSHTYLQGDSQRSQQPYYTVRMIITIENNLESS